MVTVTYTGEVVISEEEQNARFGAVAGIGNLIGDSYKALYVFELILEILRRLPSKLGRPQHGRMTRPEREIEMMPGRAGE